MVAKQCIKCNEEKEFSLFHRDAQTKDGRKAKCAKCILKEWKIKYDKDPLPFRRSAKKYSLTGKGKKAIREGAERYRKRYPEKQIAQWKARNARVGGHIKKPDKCEECNNKATLQGHHYKGYTKENWYAVKFLCPKCHTKEHKL